MQCNRRIVMLAAAAALACPLAWAQTPPAPAGPIGVPADPVVARVNAEEIHLSDIAAVAQSLPAQYHNMSNDVLYPLLLNQAIDRTAIVLQARKLGLDQDQGVQRQMEHAREQVLVDALMHREAAPLVTEDAVRARYDRDVANKTGEEELHARHILVASEAEANKIIA